MSQFALAHGLAEPPEQLTMPHAGRDSRAFFEECAHTRSITFERCVDLIQSAREEAAMRGDSRTASVLAMMSARIVDEMESPR